MLDNETKERIKDYFDVGDLLKFIGIDMDAVLEIFEDDIAECLDEIEELMDVGE